MPTQLVKPTEVALLLNLSTQTLYRLVRQGAIPVVKLGDRTIRFDMDAITRWIAAQYDPKRSLPFAFFPTSQKQQG
jgi:excisionase family DNA binding protein